jgi:hypothetical protein
VDQILGCVQAHLLDVAPEPPSNPCGLLGGGLLGTLAFYGHALPARSSRDEREPRFACLLLMIEI